MFLLRNKKKLSLNYPQYALLSGALTQTVPMKGTIYIFTIQLIIMQLFILQSLVKNLLSLTVVTKLIMVIFSAKKLS